jgi:hypothetical protein
MSMTPAPQEIMRRKEVGFASSERKKTMVVPGPEMTTGCVAGVGRLTPDRRQRTGRARAPGIRRFTKNRAARGPSGKGHPRRGSHGEWFA